MNRPRSVCTPSARKNFSRLLPLLILGGLVCGMPKVCAQEQLKQAVPSAPKKRLVTVQDGIELTRLADPDYGLSLRPAEGFARFSPDGKLFVILLKKGDMANDTNEFSLLLFHSAEALDSPKRDVIVKMASSSNRDAISNVRWLADGHTLVFLGENRDEVSQVFSFDIKNRRLKRLTHHPTAITSYDITSDGRELVFLADPIVDRAECDRKARRYGIVVVDQQLPDLIRDPCGKPVEVQYLASLFVQRGTKSPGPLRVSERIRSDAPISLSPDGRYVLVGETVRECPSLWKGYQSEHIQNCFSGKYRAGGRIFFGLRHYLLVDVDRAAARPLLDVPSYLWLPHVEWAADSRSVDLPNMYLPLNGADEKELDARRKTRYGVRVEIPSLEYHKLEHRVPAAETPRVPLSVTVEEDVNRPPKIFVSDPETKRKALLLDPNPQLADIELGSVEVIAWKDSTGREWRGGLYLPIGYVAGKRYPLVIQTHGFSAARFSIDGLIEWSSAFAARPLAAAGFAVLQASGYSFNNLQEGPRGMAEYQGAIDYLDEKGIIDRNRVGITGFSRTFYDVGYTLTHSTYRFAAAVLAEGEDASYFQFVARDDLPDSVALNGGEPFGEGLETWLKNSPGFNLTRVHTPIRVMAFGASGGVLENWEWFSMLARLQKPVEFLLLPDADHELIKPWERETSQQGLVDWFRFWLKGEQDVDPAKSGEYARWRELRNMQQVNLPE